MEIAEEQVRIIQHVIEMTELMMLILEELEFQEMQLVKMTVHEHHQQERIIHHHVTEIQEQESEVLREIIDPHNRQQEIEMHPAEEVNLQNQRQEKEAKDMFEKAYKVYSIFWALKLQLITGEKVQQAAKDGSTSFTAGDSQLEELVTKLADCCNE